MKTEQILVVILLVVSVGVIAHAQSRFDVCRRMGDKTIGCVLSF